MSQEEKAPENSPTEARPVENSEKVQADEVVKPDNVQLVADRKEDGTEKDISAEDAKKDGPEDLTAEEYVARQEQEKRQKQVRKAMQDIQKILDDNGLTIHCQEYMVPVDKSGRSVRRLEAELVDAPKKKKS